MIWVRFPVWVPQQKGSKMKKLIRILFFDLKRIDIGREALLLALPSLLLVLTALSNNANWSPYNYGILVGVSSLVSLGFCSLGLLRNYWDPHIINRRSNFVLTECHNVFYLTTKEKPYLRSEFFGQTRDRHLDSCLNEVKDTLGVLLFVFINYPELSKISSKIAKERVRLIETIMPSPEENLEADFFKEDI